MLLKTPLYERHVELGGKIVPFAGYEMPVQFATGVIAEHNAVRNNVGIFDVSHMGEVQITGKDALLNMNRIFTNDFTTMKTGGIRYTVMCNETGGVIDDMIVYKRGEENYFVVVNASNKQKDFDWIKAHITGEAKAENLSEDFGQIAVQGPNSAKVLEKLVTEGTLPQKYFTFTEDAKLGGISCILSQNGYTGSFGFEIYCKAENTVEMWNQILKAGEELGLIPCGLGARDTLRLEASLPLYGHELSEEIDPLTADLGFCVKLGKEDFIGKQALLNADKSKKRAGFKLTERGIARENCDIIKNGEVVGITTSGTHCPYLGGAYAMGMISTELAVPGEAVEIEVRGKRIKAEVTAMPFYRR